MNKLAELILEDAQLVFEKVNYGKIADRSILITGASGLIGTHFLASLNYLKAKTNLPFKTYFFIHSDPTEYFNDITGFEGLEISSTRRPSPMQATYAYPSATLDAETVQLKK